MAMMTDTKVRVEDVEQFWEENINDLGTLEGYNSMLSYYLKHKQILRFNQLIYDMDQKKVVPDKRTLTVCAEMVVSLNLNRHSPVTQFVEDLVDKIERYKVELESETVSKLIEFVLGSRYLNFSILDSVINRFDISICNVMIKNSAFKGDYKDCWRLVQNVIHKGGTPTFETYYWLLRACEKGGLVQHIETILPKLTEFSPQLSPEIYSSLISVYSRGNRLNSAIKILRLMELKSMKPTWKSILDLAYAYQKGNDRRPVMSFSKDTISFNVCLATCRTELDVLNLLYEMKEKHVPLDNLSKFFVVRFFILDMKDLIKAEKIVIIWNEEDPHSGPVDLSYDPLASYQIQKMYHDRYHQHIKSGDLKMLLKLMKDKETLFGITMHINDYQSLAIFYSKHSKCFLDDINRLIKKMEENGFLPTTLIYTLLLEYYTQKEDKSGISRTLKYMRTNKINLDNVAINVLIKFYGRRADFSSVDKLLLQMEKQKLTPSLDTYNTLLKIYVDSWDDQRIYSLIDKLKQHQVPWDAYTYHNMITLNTRANNHSQTMILFNEMVTRMIKPLPPTYLVILMMYARNSHIQGFWKFLDIVKSERVFPGLTLICSTIIRKRFTSYENVENFVVLRKKVIELLNSKEMGTINHHEKKVMYWTFLTVMCMGTLEDVEEAIKILVQRGVVFDYLLYNTLVYFYWKKSFGKLWDLMGEVICLGNSGQWVYSSLIRVISQTDERGLIKLRYCLAKNNIRSPYLYTALIENYCRKERENEALSIYSEFQKTGAVTNMRIYSAFLKMHLSKKSYKAFERIVTKIRKKAFPGIDIHFYNLLLEYHLILQQKSQFLRLLKEIHSSKMVIPNLHTYELCILFYSKYKLKNEMEHCYQQIFNEGYLPNLTILRYMIVYYKSSGQLEKMNQLFMMMKEHCIIPNPSFLQFLAKNNLLTKKNSKSTTL
uniref:PROP1-like PPR domain-containing protein n=1 Tax=Arcella intermedia TaxID=1963864 RepID=A0A6B2KXJ6_9EUKA